MMVEDEDLLLAVLNSSPVLAGVATEQMAGDEGHALMRRFGAVGTESELAHLRRAREALQGIVRGDGDAAEGLAASIDRAALLPEVTPEGIRWRLDVPADERLAARSVLAWSRVVKELPGRLRACANTECRLFLVDHSRPGTAKWCSMSTCGNRMKARTHARRSRSQTSP